MTKRDTRELILETSLKLFNESGEPYVTTNQIADEADISPGNLYYHFNNKQAVIIALFKRFIVQLEPLIDVPALTRLEAEDFWFHLHLSFELKGHYRFLYRNLADITQRNPDLEHAFRGLFRRERLALENLLSALEHQGALRIRSGEKELLLDNLMLANIYWIPYADFFDEQGMAMPGSQAKAIAGVLQMVLPYLRAPEREDFAAITSRYLSHSA